MRAVQTDDGRTIECDFVVVGIGVVPRVELAETAGLTTDNGILVDQSLATSAPGVYAAGDVANAWHPFYERHVRVEHWANALNQGPAAARAMLGQAVSYDRIPYFFSDQYDVGMEYSGFATEWDEVVFRGDPASREFIAFWLSGRARRGGMNVNVWDVNEQVQALIRSRQGVDVAALTDPDTALDSLVDKSKPTPSSNRWTPCTASPTATATLEAGVSIWLDTLSRELLESGEFAELVRDYAVTGATSNPTIFAKAITGSDRYDDQLRAAVAAGVDRPQELFFEIALEDVRRAAEALRPTYEATGRPRRLRLLRVHPGPGRRHRGHDRPGARALAAARPAERDDQGPGHRGRRARDRAADRRRRQRQRDAAVLGRALRPGDRGLPERTRAPRESRESRSTASPRSPRSSSHGSTRRPTPLLPPDSPLRGEIAIANAHRAYGRYLERFAGERWDALCALGARQQRPLWASTGTKDPAYSDVLYVERLIAPGVINTMPEKTLRAFADHGIVGPRARRRPERRRAGAGRGRGSGPRPRRDHRDARARGCQLVLQLLRRVAALHRLEAGRGSRDVGNELG